jgi:hypothetical protein
MSKTAGDRVKKEMVEMKQYSKKIKRKLISDDKLNEWRYDELQRRTKK